MGICYQKTVKQPTNYYQQSYDQSFYLSQHQQNSSKYLFYMHTYAMSQLTLKKLISHNINLEQAKSHLAQHANQIENFLEEIKDLNSFLNKRISQYQNNEIKKLLFFDLISIKIKQINNEKNVLLKVQSLNKQYFEQKIDVNNYQAFPRGIFIQEKNQSKNFQIEISLKDNKITISQNQLSRYLFPLCQSANIRLKGTLTIIGQIYFKAQYIFNIKEYKQKMIEYLNSRQQMIKNILKSNNQQLMSIQNLAGSFGIQQEI